MVAGAVDLGPFKGEVAPGFREREFVAQLRELPSRLGPAGPAEPFRRNRLVRTDLGPVTVAVKAFPRQGWLRSLLARVFGSKARRSWEVAQGLWRHEVGTPRPIAFLERWQGQRLVESYFLTEFASEITTFHQELLAILHDEPDFDRLLNLLDPVAAAVRAMHDAGIRHGDLGNQNIFLRRTGPAEWGDVKFIDVNRGRVREHLSLRERAFDLSRLTLPRKLQRIFREMYFRERTFAGQRPPRALVRWERFYRVRFWIHTKTRALRHPIRSRRRRAGRTRRTYPKLRDYWLWDKRTDQAIGVLGKWQRMLFHVHWAQLRVVPATVVALFRVAQAYLFRRGRLFRDPVELKGRVGMTLHPTPETVDRELALLERLGPIPVLVRYYHHESAREWDFTSRLVRDLHGKGHAVSIALVQDRRAVREPGRWDDFVTRVLAAVDGCVDLVEVGHATNRVKWGIWNLREYARLLEPFRDRPGVRITGPAINDFEYHYVLAGVGCLPRGRRFHALSLHLYVDRRGAPEQRQHGFSALDKFFLARMLAESSRRCENRVVVSEVNWMLQDLGGYAHRFAPYKSAASKKVFTSISEDDYANYMLRYYLHALCSGMVDRVYWWRLVSRPFGLVDDGDPEHWRARVAYRVLQVFLDTLGEATFVGRAAAAKGTHVLRFRRPAGDEVAVAFTSKEPAAAAFPFSYERVLDATGAERTELERIDGRPVYLLGVAGR